MAINFPNDPATNPGDGGQWTDTDGNLWQVEIISGEAVWTMIQAADTGGGGGAVDSVAGKTGVVVLELNDLTDVDTSGATTDQVLKYNGSSFAPADDETSPLDTLLSVDGDAVKYDTAPTLGVDATDVVIPTMGQVRAAIASNGGTSVALNDLTDVSYSGGSLQITDLDEIQFGSTDVPADSTWKFYVNSVFGLNFGAFTTSSSEGSFIRAHEAKGIDLRTTTYPVYLSSENDLPELRFNNGQPFTESGAAVFGNYIGFKMPSGVSSDVTWILPAVDGVADSVLTTDGAGNLTFEPLPSVTVPSTTYVINYESTTSYKFTGPGLDGTELNPTLYVVRGQKYIFSNTLGAHPFQLQTVAGTGESPYTDGVTGDQPIDLGSFEWEVQMDAPSTLFYQCTVHAAMAGSIKVLDNSGAGGAGAVDSVNSQTGVVSLGIQDMNDYELESGNSYLFAGPNVGTTAPVVRNEWGAYEVTGNYYFVYTKNEGEHIADFALLENGDAISFSFDGGAAFETTINTGATDNGSDSNWIKVNDSWPAEAATATTVLVTSSRFTVPGELTDGDVLQWNDSTSKFQPTALATVATSGDYNDLINAPTVADAPVTSVNTETGDVSLGIQDMNDYGDNPGTYAQRTLMSGSPEVKGQCSQETTANSDDGFKINNGNAAGDVDYGAPAIGEPLYVSADGGATWLTFEVQSVASTGAPGPYLYYQIGVTDISAWTALNVPLGTTILFANDLTSGDGAVLTWDAASSKFQPKALDYGDIANTPAAATRKTVDITATLDAGATTTGEVTGTGATGFLLSCQTDVASWIRIYTDSASMTADAARTKDTDPAPGSGVLFEALYTSTTEKPITPGTSYFNLAGDDKLFYRLTNESAVNGASITVTLKLLPME